MRDKFLSECFEPKEEGDEMNRYEKAKRLQDEPVPKLG
jgi:hypothetical protein